MAPGPPAFPPGYLQEYSGDTLIGLAIAFTILDTLFVTLRFLARYIGRTPYGWDDVFVVATLPFCYALHGMAIAMVKHAGVGRHIAYVAMKHPKQIVLWAQILSAAPMVYNIAASLPKFAILAFYLRIFSQKPYRLACYATGTIMLMTTCAAVFGGVFKCWPIAYFWDKTIPGGHCINTNAFFLWGSFPNIITDMVMLALPLPLIWKLQISPKVKVGLTATFLTGSIGLVTSILRFHSFSQTDAIKDGTWASVKLFTWTIVEPGVYLVASCLPVLRPLGLFLRGRGRLNSESDRNKYSASGSSHLGGFQGPESNVRIIGRAKGYSKNRDDLHNEIELRTDIYHSSEDRDESKLLAHPPRAMR